MRSTPTSRALCNNWVVGGAPHQDKYAERKTDAKIAHMTTTVVSLRVGFEFGDHLDAVTTTS
jgi:hypothetical protein